LTKQNWPRSANGMGWECLCTSSTTSGFRASSARRLGTVDGVAEAGEGFDLGAYGAHRVAFPDGADGQLVYRHTIGCFFSHPPIFVVGLCVTLISFIGVGTPGFVLALLIMWFAMSQFGNERGRPIL
jgi:hypothetical protein